MASTNYYFRVLTVLAAVIAAVLVAVIMAYGTASAQVSSGATITVNTTQDESTPSDGTCSLREAITNANDNVQTSPRLPTRQRRGPGHHSLR